MINSYQSTPSEYIRKDNFPSNQANSEQSESSTGESQYKDEISNKKKMERWKEKMKMEMKIMY